MIKRAVNGNMPDVAIRSKPMMILDRNVYNV